MTTYRRKWTILPLALGAIITVGVATAAAADDDSYYTPQTQQKIQQHQTSNDRQYQMPSSYQGQYYPNDESAIGYHGTAKTSQNDTPDPGNNGNYYYYYY